jgi:hypothetical protein
MPRPPRVLLYPFNRLCHPNGPGALRLAAFRRSNLQTFKRSIVFLLLLWGLLLVACARQPPAPTPAPPLEANYIHEDYGFAVNLPEGWQASSESSWREGVHQVLFSARPGQSGPANSVVMVVDDPDLSANEFLTILNGGVMPATLANTTLAGLPARRGTVGGNGSPPLQFVLVEREGKLYYVDFHDPESLEPLEDVIASFQFIDG